MTYTTAKRRLRRWATLYGHAPRLNWQRSITLGRTHLLDATCPRCGHNGQAWAALTPPCGASGYTVDPLTLATPCAR